MRAHLKLNPTAAATLLPRTAAKEQGLLPLYRECPDLDGHSLKIIVALILRSQDGWTGQTEIDELRRPLRASPARVTECLEKLSEAGVLRYTYRLGVIDFWLRRCKSAARVPREHLRALVLLAPSDVKLYFAVLLHCNPDDGLAWPGIVRLMGILRRCRRTVERGVRSLREAGLLVVSRVHWTRLPRFRWPLRTRPMRKRVMVFARPNPPPGALTLSRSTRESRRWVREAVEKELCEAGARQRIMVDLESLPPDLRGMATLGATGEPGCDFRRRKTLEAVGMTVRQAGWVCARFPVKSIDLALQVLNARWRGVRDRGRYVVGILRRVEACC